MINKEALQQFLTRYKENFVKSGWEEEKYKWEAVKCFQTNWNVNAQDFPSMLEASLAKTKNLLASSNYYPMKMITIFSKEDPEKVRAMFIDLYDESRDVAERMISFKENSINLLKNHDNGHLLQHYQQENAVSTYLWLRYPDKYYIYKLSEIKKVSSRLESSYSFKKGSYADNIRNFFSFYDEICEELKKDEELRKLFASRLTESCYPDPQLKTLTIDVGFYISRDHVTPPSVEWRPSKAEYSPEISVDKWKKLLNDREVFTEDSLKIMKRMLEEGGEATCTELADKYGESFNFYNEESSQLAERVHDKTGCPLLQSDNEDSRWWPVLYQGKEASGCYIWKLRDELSEALKETDLTEVDLYSSPENYWFLTANPKIWRMSDMEVNSVQDYTLYNDNGNKRRIFQNFLDAGAGDMVIGYESTPVKKIVALMKISAPQDGKKIYFEKVEGLQTPVDLMSFKDAPELKEMEFLTNPQGSLFKLTKAEYDFLLDMIREENPVAAGRKMEKYDKSDFLDEVYISQARYDRMAAVLKKKKNIILEGAPGVGKTFLAKRLAYSIMGEIDEDRIEFVQFHQNYSYEDFVMGYKPDENGFKLEEGIFFKFCQKAANHPDKDYFFIIDEINRGNMSKIFGELLMLIEADYRGQKATLAYNGLKFSVPKRLYIIGMMNTADRSLAMIDYALRRRFSFFDIEPGFDSEGFIKYQKSLSNDTFDMLIKCIKELNSEISQDRSLGKGFCIGHSYFCNAEECTEEWMKDVVDFDILPMLNEYWFDDETKLQRWENILKGIFQ